MFLFSFYQFHWLSSYLLKRFLAVIIVCHTTLGLPQDLLSKSELHPDLSLLLAVSYPVVINQLLCFSIADGLNENVCRGSVFEYLVPTWVG